jgi:hypothetical protein
MRRPLLLPLRHNEGGGVVGASIILMLVSITCLPFMTVDSWAFVSPPTTAPSTRATTLSISSRTSSCHSTTLRHPSGVQQHHRHPSVKYRRHGQQHCTITLFGTVQPYVPIRTNNGLFSLLHKTSTGASATGTWTTLWAKGGSSNGGKKNINVDDDDWEPDEEELLNELEELGDLEVVDDDLNEGLEDPDAVQQDDDDDDDEDELDDDDDDDVDGTVRSRRRRIRTTNDDDDDDEFQVENVDDIWADAEEEDDGEWEDSADSEYEYVYEDDDDGSDDDEALRELLNDPDFEDLPLEDDMTDPIYTERLRVVQETAERRIAVLADETFDALDYIRNRMSDDERKVMDSFIVNQDSDRQVNEYVNSVIDVSDIENIDVDAELATTPDLYDDDPYEKTDVNNFAGTGVTDDDIAALDEAWKETNAALSAAPWNKVDEKGRHFDFWGLDNATKEELLEADYEIGGSPYNHTKWLIYDLDFNVSNLLLAACKHNPNAPVILNHWLPQLEIYERYRHVRERGFDFTWEDVEKADIDELKRYYLGFGYDEIPEKAPAETGLIGFGELEEEELKMAAFEKWMLEVYNEEWDRKDFDDEKIVDEDNVFSDNFVMPQHPDLPTMEETNEDLAKWKNEIENDHYDVLEEGGEAAEEIYKYRDMMGENIDYKPMDDKDFQENFRGHLVIACGDFESDLDMAEAITTRFEKEFGNQVYVETKIMMHVREDDYVFEVWLESYEIDLIHSRRRSFLGTDGWTGPGDVDAKQLDYLVDQVRMMISDDSRYSYAVTQLDMQAS